MQFPPAKRTREHGSVLFITLMLAAILGATLAGYLGWVHTQNVLVAQSQAWNRALAVAEAGIEEGMAQVNVCFGTNYLPSVQTNWVGPASGAYGPRTNSFADGYYSVVLVTSGAFPTIISTGYASVPFIGRQIARTVQVTTTTSAAFGNAIVAMQNISFKGNNITIDSFDSADPLHSTNGMYYAPWRKAGGNVNSINGVVDVANGDIYGKLRTGPGGSYNMGPNGQVGDLNWTGPGIETGWYANDFNAEIKDVPMPNTTGFVAPTGSGTNTYVLGSAGYIINGDLSLKTGDTMYVNGNATLYVSGNVNMQGQSLINIAPGAQLKIIVGGASATFTQVNTTGNAFSFQYYGLPTNTSMTWSGNATYVGTVYAPEALFSCGGGGSTIYDYQGSCICNSVWMNGHFNVHYDENLARAGFQSGFIVASWQEL